jgi:hypothetical protein
VNIDQKWTSRTEKEFSIVSKLTKTQTHIKCLSRVISGNFHLVHFYEAVDGKTFVTCVIEPFDFVPLLKGVNLMGMLNRRD